jgi:hypothetical protein
MISTAFRLLFSFFEKFWKTALTCFFLSHTRAAHRMSQAPTGSSDDGFNTFTDPNWTYHYDKLSCWKGAYFAHVVFAYLVLFSGIGCFVTRILPGRYKFLHLWCGRAYWMSMLWCAGTSMLIHNSGLPAAVLLSFLWVLIFMCIGWIAANFHQMSMDKQAMANVQAAINREGLKGNLKQIIAEEKGRIIHNRTFVQRFFSWKTLHGVVMFVSWVNIAGRIPASNQSGDFTCYTYPVYKPIYTPHGNFTGTNEIKLLEIHDPNYHRYVIISEMSLMVLQKSR